MLQNITRLLVLTFVLNLVLAMPALAREGEKVHSAGTVTAIDLAGQNFTVSDRNNNTVKIFVNPATEFEIEKGKGFLRDDDIPFKDLKIGDWVKVESYRVKGELEAEEVEVYRE